MLANWSRQRFWDCVVSSQRDIFGAFLFRLRLKIPVFFKKILIFHTVRAFSPWQVVVIFSEASLPVLMMIFIVEAGAADELGKSFLMLA
ncbi:hypothetical protein [Herbaspirillum sp.]|uniref:hypothetical protein n=1 Tax=Herbaspirillum sp. TaxID=1890675 RepID=UPI0031E2439A